MLCWRSVGTARILDFDCEARPLSWIGGDYVSREVTAIGAKFIDEDGDVQAWCLGEVDAPTMLEAFRELYDEAGMVVGHNIRRYDLPTLNAMMIENGLPALGAKLAHDTYLDLMKRSGISASQKNLAESLGVQLPKIGMSDPAWRDANRLRPEGIRKAHARVTGDVLQNIELRQRLMDHGYLGRPRVWRP